MGLTQKVGSRENGAESLLTKQERSHKEWASSLSRLKAIMALLIKYLVPKMRLCTATVFLTRQQNWTEMGELQGRHLSPNDNWILMIKRNTSSFFFNLNSFYGMAWSFVQESILFMQKVPNSILDIRTKKVCYIELGFFASHLPRNLKRHHPWVQAKPSGSLVWTGSCSYSRQLQKWPN